MKTITQNLEMLRGPDLAMLMRRRENSLRKATGKGTLSRNLTPLATPAEKDEPQGEQTSAETELTEPLRAQTVLIWRSEP